MNFIKSTFAQLKEKDQYLLTLPKIDFPFLQIN